MFSVVAMIMGCFPASCVSAGDAAPHMRSETGVDKFDA
jgi:hypothetical protein